VTDLEREGRKGEKRTGKEKKCVSNGEKGSGKEVEERE